MVLWLPNVAGRATGRGVRLVNEMVLVLGLLVVVMVLLSLEVVAVDVVALGILVVLMVTGVLTPAEALAGFGNEAIVILAGLFVLTAGLKSSGAVDEIGRWAERLAGARPTVGVPVLLVLVAVVSALMNNTTCTALFLPVAIAVAQGTRQSSSRVLMPMAFASILGGTLTVIGTSTNVIVRGLLPQYGEAPLAMFELAPVALPIAIVGLVYLAVARRFLPDRGAEDLGHRYPLRDYLTDVEVLGDSPLVGKTVREADLGRSFDLNLLALRRGERLLAAEAHERLESGDILLVEGRAESIAGLGEGRGLRVRARSKDPADGTTRRLRMVEATVLPRSELVGRSLQEASFRQRYGANVVALNRHGEAVMEKLGRIRLRVGDVLLILGGPETSDNLAGRSGLQVLANRPAGVTRLATWTTAGIFVATVALGTSGVLDLGAAVLAGCLALLAARELTPQEAYAAIEWRLLVLVVGMLAFAAAMVKTGAAAWLAELVVGVSAGFGPRLVLAAFYLLTLLLTQPMSNQAAALVVLPLAMEVAADVGIAPRAMAVTVALAASSSFLTPFEPSCLLVYGAGRYRFGDFPRFGVGLTALAAIVTLLLVPVFWPL